VSVRIDPGGHLLSSSYSGASHVGDDVRSQSAIYGSFCIKTLNAHGNRTSGDGLFVAAAANPAHGVEAIDGLLLR